MKQKIKNNSNQLTCFQSTDIEYIAKLTNNFCTEFKIIDFSVKRGGCISLKGVSGREFIVSRADANELLNKEIIKGSPADELKKTIALTKFKDKEESNSEKNYSYLIADSNYKKKPSSKKQKKVFKKTNEGKYL